MERKLERFDKTCTGRVEVKEWKKSGIGTVTEAAEKAVEAFGEKTLEELTEENKRLQEENERLKNRSIKERMYDKINVSVRTIDIFIGCMCVLFVAVVVMGMLK